ncbi:MAG: DUF805 domain-containing protein [Actinomycetales bacterium]|nr:DUF805 domain-containing protein [Actinomycetales bacterium]
MTNFPPPPPGFGLGIPQPAEVGSAGPGPIHAESASQVSPEHGFYQPPAAVAACLRRYAQFRGRASRSEFWWFYVFLTLCLVAAAALDVALGFTPGATAAAADSSSAGPVQAIVSFGLLIPLMAVFTRRMHDVGRSGGYFLWVLTGLGTIWVLVRLCQSGGANRDNRYGVRP